MYRVLEIPKPIRPMPVVLATDSGCNLSKSWHSSWPSLQPYLHRDRGGMIWGKQLDDGSSRCQCISARISSCHQYFGIFFSSRGRHHYSEFVRETNDGEYWYLNGTALEALTQKMRRGGPVSTVIQQLRFVDRVTNRDGRHIGTNTAELLCKLGP